jgi:hypothetical protein
VTFVSQPDGSLVGTFTTSATYTAWGGGSIGNFQPWSGDPKAGQTFTLVPIAPMFAKASAGSGVGNPYLCQTGLAEPAIRSCGA